jgi:hypothetical protein
MWPLPSEVVVPIAWAVVPGGGDVEGERALQFEASGSGR